MSLLSCLSLVLLSPVGISVAGAAAGDPFPLERLFEFGPDGTVATDFKRIDSVALDQQDEHVYVLENEPGSPAGTLLKFDLHGNPIDFGGTSPYIDDNRITGLEPFGKNFANTTQIAVNPVSQVFYVTETDVLRAFEADGEPAEFTAGPGVGTSEIPGFSELASVAVDANGSIYASDRTGTVSVFASTGALLTSFSVVNPFDIGVDPSGRVYLAEGAEAIKRFTPSSFPVSGSTTYTSATFILAVGGSSLIRGLGIDPITGEVHVIRSNFTKTWLQRYDSASPPTLLDSFGAPGTPTEASAFGGQLQGIAIWGGGKKVSGGETIKLYVGNRGGSPAISKVAALGGKTKIGRPDIENTSALEVTADSVKLRSWVDPNTGETTYRFEYGLEDCAVSTCVSVPLGGASAGDGVEPVEVSQRISGLLPATTYHYRVVAENSFGLTVDPGRTFTTQALGLGFDLIDSRVWEMVSPPDKRGAQLKGAKGGLIQAASDGEGLAYLSLGSIEAEPQGNRAIEFSPILARRGSTGWSSKDIASPNQETVSAGSDTEGEFKFFSPDLSRGILMPRGSTPLSPQASERTPYLRQNSDPPVYTPLLTGKEGFANVPAGVEFGPVSDLYTNGKVIPVGATPDLTHVVLESYLPDSLVEGFSVPGPPPLALYLWAGGKLQPISVRPAGEGGTMALDPSFGSKMTTLQHAISADGSRVFWGASTALYMRDTIAEETVRLDVVQGGDGTGGATPVFQGASSDGTVVFFRDTRRLTPDASPSGRDLYRCEIPAGSPTTGCASLTNLSAPLAGSGKSSEMLGMVSGLSEDGARVYFTARGVLDKVPNQYGESAGGDDPNLHPPNLYLWEEGEGVRFIATLAEEDRGSWGNPATVVSPGLGYQLSAAISPSGRHFSFMSQRSLSGYLNLDEDGDPVQEVFRYDAVTENLDCLSCNPFNAAPEAEAPLGRPLVNPEGQYNNVQLAAVIPPPFRNELVLMLYRPRTVLDSGRVFFNAFDSLVPADSNGEWDVYQWEPTGVGGCNASSGDTATVRSAGGCVSLLSSGTADEEAVFLDASVSGDDAFFLTPARLSAIDRDDEFDVYDARVGGVEVMLPPNPECQGEACRSAAAPPGDSVPSSATFVGPGNVKPAGKNKRCPKGKRKVRVKGKVRCITRKQSRRQGKASQNRGTVG